MNREDAKTYILSHATEYLERDKSGKGFICPVCKSGSGNKGTGITTLDKVHYTCWTGCYSNSDILDIIGLQYGLTDYNSKLEKACSLFGITLDNYSTGNQNQPKSEQYTHTHIHIHTKDQPKEVKEEAPQDYTDFFLQASQNIEKTDYHRDISLATLQRFHIGYVEDWKHPKCPNHTGTPRLIIPTSKESYIARATRLLTEQEEEQGIVEKSKVSKVHIFNSEALRTAQKPIVIVEGEIDALSVIDVGGEAVGLGGVSNANKLLTILEAEKPVQPLILALDNDGAGEQACSKLKKGLEALGIAYIESNIAGGYKDANEALCSLREDFSKRVHEAMNEAVEAQQELARQEEVKHTEALEELERESAYCSMEAFRSQLKEADNNSFIPTGFKSVDKLLDGGLYSGLYIIGAISSLGKTTFCLQLADNVARAGTDVLIFSLEMAKNELFAKSISRLTFELDNTSNHREAQTTRSILSKYKAHAGVIDNAYYKYLNEVSRHIYITEGMGNVSVNDIRAKVERYKNITGKAPLVLIDYLQILQPMEPRATDKQNTDMAVTALKRLSRDFDIPVLAISSFNRENYTESVNLTAFKESGAIEYSSDILIGLQYKGMEEATQSNQENTKKAEVKKLMEKNFKLAGEGEAQKIELKVLKQRNGSKGSCTLNYYPMFNYFTEEGEAEHNTNTGEFDFSKLE